MDWLVLSNKFEIFIKEERRKERSVSMFRWWSFVKRKKEEIQVRIIIDNRRKRKIVDVMRNVLCFLWIVAILKIEDFVIAEADPAILLGSDLSHFQQVRKIFCLIYSSSSSFFFLESFSIFLKRNLIIFLVDNRCEFLEYSIIEIVDFSSIYDIIYNVILN